MRIAHRLETVMGCDRVVVLSAGTDYLVKLWRAAAISSAPPALDEAEPELSEAEAITWVTPLLDVPALETRLAAMLAEKASPSTVTRAAPWA